jgi:hypothetical protein
MAKEFAGPGEWLAQIKNPGFFAGTGWTESRSALGNPGLPGAPPIGSAKLDRNRRQVIEAIGLNPGPLQRRANLLAEQQKTRAFPRPGCNLLVGWF